MNLTRAPIPKQKRVWTQVHTLVCVSETSPFRLEVPEAWLLKSFGIR